MLKKWKFTVAISLLSGLLNILPARSAEKILLTYGPLKFSLSVSSLANYANNGSIDQNLQNYLSQVNPEDRSQLRIILTKRIPINPVMASRFLNSAMGERFLDNMGNIINIEGGINGKYAIRGAVVQAAFEPGGFTLLGFLEKFPTNIQFQGETLLPLYEKISLTAKATELFVKKMRQWTNSEADSSTPWIDFAKLPDLRKPGRYQVKKEVWQLNDTARNRQFYVVVYQPIDYQEDKIPVVIFSHGLNSRPEDFGDQAEHLGTYGFLVALPQHPGSDLQYFQAMKKGFHRNIFDVNEFINRPLDISYLIDELERRNNKDFGGKLGLDSVGAFGHSFGGYTVLSLAGAQINFDYLADQCNNNPLGILNNSLLLQCRALELPHKQYDFRDKRISSVIIINPVNRALFGPKGIGEIQVPIVIISGSYDPATPPVFEQVSTFTWLKVPDKYFVLAEGQAHVDLSKLDAGITSSVESIGDLELPSPLILRGYFYALSTAFSQVYVAHNKNYLPYLQSSYAVYLSKGNKFQLNFISDTSSSQLMDTVNKFRQDNNLTYY